MAARIAREQAPTLAKIVLAGAIIGAMLEFARSFLTADDADRLWC